MCRIFPKSVCCCKEAKQSCNLVLSLGNKWIKSVDTRTFLLCGRERRKMKKGRRDASFDLSQWIQMWPPGGTKSWRLVQGGIRTVFLQSMWLLPERPVPRWAGSKLSHVAIHALPYVPSRCTLELFCGTDLCHQPPVSSLFMSPLPFNHLGLLPAPGTWAPSQQMASTHASTSAGHAFQSLYPKLAKSSSSYRAQTRYHWATKSGQVPCGTGPACGLSRPLTLVVH